MAKNNYPKLILKDGTEFPGQSFGANISVSGEVVFATGMVGYPEALTDPSFKGQILVMTYPLIGNYGVPKKESFESKKIQVSGLIVCNYIDTPSHYSSVQTLASWFKKEGIPLLQIKDTRELTQKLRESGVMQGIMLAGYNKVKFKDPNLENLAALVSTKEILEFIPRNKSVDNTIVVIDCGVKQNIIRRLTARNLKVVVVPWDTDVTKLKFPFKAVVISNGPGDPMKAGKTINNVKKIIARKIPILGICLGNQILGLAMGGTTYKLKFGHRSQNQPCVAKAMQGAPALKNRVFLTTQNHGFALKKIPSGFKEWFYNANDHTNEGIIHESLPFMSVQFHPESSPGPLDTDWIFDYFLTRAKINYKNEKK